MGYFCNFAGSYFQTLFNGLRQGLKKLLYGSLFKPKYGTKEKILGI